MNREPTFWEVWAAFTYPVREWWQRLIDRQMDGMKELMLLAPWVRKRFERKRA